MGLYTAWGFTGFRGLEFRVEGLQGLGFRV